MREGEIALEIKNLSKYFGQVKVLENFNLTVQQGEFVALVGKSGCGKSTLLRLISKLDTFQQGEIFFLAASQKKINPQIRYLFQEPRLLPWKTVWQNTALGSKNRAKEKALDSLAQVGLAEKAEVWPHLLSGGQKQRVALARALAGEPKMLLLDEPLGALDALTRIQMQALIENIWQKQGFTVILVTHDVSEAVYLADRVVLIEDGSIKLDEKITLARPRIRDSSFAHFEKLILDKVLGEDAVKVPPESYVI